MRRQQSASVTLGYTRACRIVIVFLWQVFEVAVAQFDCHEPAQLPSDEAQLAHVWREDDHLPWSISLLEDSTSHNSLIHPTISTFNDLADLKTICFCHRGKAKLGAPISKRHEFLRLTVTATTAYTSQLHD